MLKIKANLPEAKPLEIIPEEPPFEPTDRIAESLEKKAKYISSFGKILEIVRQVRGDQ